MKDPMVAFLTMTEDQQRQAIADASTRADAEWAADQTLPNEQLTFLHLDMSEEETDAIYSGWSPMTLEPADEFARRALVGASHQGGYTYWLDSDHYVYQFNEKTKQWQGWICHCSVWERWEQKATTSSKEEDPHGTI
jgi:hypothetical protein